jgi:hypothetical protein
MINPMTDKLMSLKDVARLSAFKRNGKPAHLSTVHRWVTRGAKSVAGHRVILETVRIPSGMKTTVAAVEEFIHALSHNEGPQPKEPSARKKLRALRERRNMIEAAERELEAMGVK